MNAAFFQQALERAGATQADLARHLGLAPSAVSRMLTGERQMKLLEAVQTAAFLGVAEEEVLRHAGAAAAPAPQPLRRGRPPADLAGRASPRGGDFVPIKSGARGGAEQEMFLETVGYIPRPASLANVREAYAVYMRGDSMEPRYEAGWLLHVNPFKDPRPGRDVVVYKTNQAVLIKQFIGWKGDALVLRQLNPPDEFRIPRPEVRECHLIVGSDQEG